jgi:hypothetical protein
MQPAAMKMAKPTRVPQGGTHRSRAVVRDVCGDRAVHVPGTHLKSYALGQLPEQLSIIVDFHIYACVSCRNQLQEICSSIDHWTAGAERAKRLGIENRKSIRVPTDDPAVLTVLQPEQSGHIDTRILDASKEGLKLLIPHELMRGTVLQVHLSDLFIRAEVRNCRPVGAVFHAGVLIKDVFAASGCTD